jgi:asparagine synthase (glutamine-hydrolysing)
VDDTLSPATLRTRGLFDPVAVSQLVKDDRAGRVDAAYTILSLICIEIWCRHFTTQASGDVFLQKPLNPVAV